MDPFERCRPRTFANRATAGRIGFNGALEKFIEQPRGSFSCASFVRIVSGGVRDGGGGAPHMAVIGIFPRAEVMKSTVKGVQNRG